MPTIKTPGRGWVPPEDRPIQSREQWEVEHEENYRTWLRSPCSRKTIDPFTNEELPINRDPRARQDIRFYEAAKLGFDVFSPTPSALATLLWFFRLRKELRHHLCRTLPAVG